MWILSKLSFVQVEEAVTLNVAGGLTLENPLILRFVEAVVSFLPACFLIPIIHIGSQVKIRFCLLQVGTSDAVMGLPKALTEKLIQEAL